ncbi:MAG: Tfp pilus assembly protein FimT/FimU [Phycisphaerales bacterium]
MKHHRHHLRCVAARGVKGAFTLVELLIAVGIIVLASVIVVPGFTKLLESANYSSAVNTTASALGQARALAIRTNRYTAVAFLFDTETEVCTLQVLELLSAGGTGYLSNNPTNQETASCQAFRPAEGQAPIELPKGFLVYGLSYAAQRTKAPSGDSIGVELCKIDNGIRGSGPTFNWYSGELVDEGDAPVAGGAGEVVPWLPPRSDPSNYTLAGDNPWKVAVRASPGVTQRLWTARDDQAVRHAQTFAIIFDPTGAIVSATTEGGRPMQNAYLEYVDAPTDRRPATPGPVRVLDCPTNFDPENVRGCPPRNATAAVDPTPNPEVRLRAASALAVVDAQKLAKDVGLPRPYLARPRPDDLAKAPPRRDDLIGFAVPNFADAYFNSAMVKRISTWIDRNAEVITFNRATGGLNRRTGS